MKIILKDSVQGQQTDINNKGFQVAKYISLGILAYLWVWHAIFYGFMLELLSDRTLSAISLDVTFLPIIIILSPIIIIGSLVVANEFRFGSIIFPVFFLVSVYLVLPYLLFIKKNKQIRWFFKKLFSYPYIYSIYWGGMSVTYSFPLESPVGAQDSIVDLPAKLAISILEIIPGFFNDTLNYTFNDFLLNGLTILICFAVLKTVGLVAKKIIEITSKREIIS